MAQKTQTDFQFTPDILREFLNPIKIQDLLQLLKQWGIKKLDSDLNKLDMFLKGVGTKISQKQLEDLWLLREKDLIFRSRSWIVFQFTEKDVEIRDPRDIQKKSTNYLVKHHLEFNKTIRVFKIGEEFYINLIYHGPFRLCEEELYQFKVVRSVQRVRCLLNINKGIIRINGRSLSKVQLCLRIVKEVFGITPKKLPIPAYKIGDFIKAVKPITKLTLTCPRTVGGFEGLDKIVIEGPNVVEGLYNLQSRQEIAFSFQGLQKVGPWTAAKSNSARITNRSEIQITDEAQQDQLFKILQD